MSAAPTPEATKSELSVVYIAGAHRSGSTFLGALLGAAPGVFYVGEAYRFPRPIFWPGDPGRGCSCGAPVDRCPFWSEVREELERRRPLLEELDRGQRRFEAWSKLPARLLTTQKRKLEIDGHAVRMVEFLEVVAAKAQAQIVVESSFSALRGSLYRRGGLGRGRVRFLHFVRDGRNFLASEQAITFDPEAPWPWLHSRLVIVARWITYNVAALALRIPDPSAYLRVRYEDLTLRPVETLDRVGRFMGVDLSSVADRIVAGEPVPMRHIAAGNRIRLLGSVSPRPELTQVPALTRSTTFLFWTLAGWLSLLLGYGRGQREARRAGDLPDSGLTRRRHR